MQLQGFGKLSVCSEVFLECFYFLWTWTMESLSRSSSRIESISPPSSCFQAWQHHSIHISINCAVHCRTVFCKLWSRKQFINFSTLCCIMMTILPCTLYLLLHCSPSIHSYSAPSAQADLYTEACPAEKRHVSSFSGGTEEDWTPSCSY